MSRYVGSCCLTVLLTLLGTHGARAQSPSSSPDTNTVAERLVTQTAPIKEGDLVLIAGAVRDARLLEDLALQVRKRGAFPLVRLQSDRMMRGMITEVPAKYDRQPPEWDLKLTALVDTVFNVEFHETDDAMAGLPPERVTASYKAMQPVSVLALNRNVQTVNLGNELYPTAARAKLYGISQEELAQTFWTGINVDYPQLQTSGAAVKQRLAAGKSLEIADPNGTRLRVRIEARPIFVSDGVISEEDRQRGGPALQVWLPAGEVYLTPVRGTAEGKIVVDRHYYQGKEIRGLTLTVKGGKLTEMTARSGLAPLKAEYDAAAPGKELFAFVDFGINPNVRLAPGSRLRNWVTAGMVTVGFGNNEWAGGDNAMGYNVTTFLPGATVKVDGRVLVENGVLRP